MSSSSRAEMQWR